MAHKDLPTYTDLMLPVVRAVETLGGSAQAKEIVAQVVEDLGISDEDLAITYETNGKSVITDRIAWARSYAKLGGALDSPKRSLFLLSTTGKEILALPDDEARERLAEMDREVRSERRTKSDRATTAEDAGDADQGDPEAEDDAWRGVLLQRLHRLTPGGLRGVRDVPPPFVRS